MFSRHYLWMILPLLAVGCGRAEGDQDIAATPPDLSAAEIRQARTLAEAHMQLDPSAQARTVFIKAELLPDSQAKSSQRQVLVTHYRYPGDETVLTVVDLRKHDVLKSDHHTHFPTALAPEEVERAEELARNDARLRTRLETAEPRITLQGRPYQTTKEGDAFFGHRVVEFQLMQAGRGLSSPLVHVDLTTATVHLVNE